MMDRIIREHARLIVLRVLANETNGSLNSAALQDNLQVYGIAKPRDWVHDELGWLASMGAITVTEVGSVRIASITAKGLDHVQRRIAIEGVKRPSPAES
ncbi:MAG: hypothetical protein WD928_05070 [Gammaproteobacteria bacterium]